MTVRPCADATPAQWLTRQKRNWWDLVTRGPLGYDAYARLRFIPDPTFNGQGANDADVAGDGPSEIWQLAAAVARLTPFTSTPDDCYFLVWEGYGDFDDSERRESPDKFTAAEVSIPERSCRLFHGTANDLSTWKDRLGTTIGLSIPAFVWPADRAWCVTNDVDPHFASIGAGDDAISALLTDTRIDTVVDDPDIDPPRYGFWDHDHQEDS